ncbi:MAG: phosphoribosylformylglycinamidine synthase subunit PurL [Thermoplasmataceae archaeon]
MKNNIILRSLNSEMLIKLSSDLGISLDLDEMIRLRNYFESLGREPTVVELQAMGQAWSEHCCYKSSKLYLKKYFENLKTNNTILQMEDDAGVMGMNDEYAYVLKMETHNHPSSVEPYGGSATGVGGILRDILCMGAQPVAVLDSLYFGTDFDTRDDDRLSTKFIIENIVGGIRDYGNRVGIPTVSGSVNFHERFTGVPLVNAGCLGVVEKKNISRSRVWQAGEILVLAGGRTGRDGIHGVNFASRVLNSQDKERDRAVQLGNPIIKEPLIHAILEANQKGLISGMKDLGGGGLSSSAGEMCLSGNCGGEIFLDKVITKERGMEPWEIWVSESQERMLISVKKENLNEILEIFSSWDVECSEIGKSIEGKNMKLFYNSDIVMDLPLQFLTSGPIYARPYRLRRERIRIYPFPVESPDLSGSIMEVISDPNVCARFNIVRQYDHTVRGNSIVKPFTGIPNSETHSDGNVMKVLDNSMQGLVMTTGCNVNATSLDAYAGTMNSLSEAVRNILCSGGNPDSVVDSLNFGNPENIDVLGQFIDSIRAISQFCKEMKLPVVAGNVSFYNNFRGLDIPPVPNIMMVGIIKDIRKAISTEFKHPGNLIVLLGSSTYDLSGSVYLNLIKHPSHDFEKTVLSELKTLKDNFIKVCSEDIIIAAHDVSSGGLISCILEMCFGYEYGAVIDLSYVSNSRIYNKLFSEGGNRIIIEIAPENLEKL